MCEIGDDLTEFARNANPCGKKRWQPKGVATLHPEELMAVLQIARQWLEPVSSC